MQAKASHSLTSQMGQAKSTQDGQEKPKDQPLLSHIKNDPLLEGISSKTIRRAWFAMAHLIVKDGDRVVDMGCQDGAQTYAMAVQNPNVAFLGVDKDEQAIKNAQENYKLSNLDFQCADIEEEFLPENSVDAIINSFTLHEIYSNHKCNERSVTETIEKQFKALKENGQFFVQAHILPSNSDYVLMEMIDGKVIAKENNDIEQMSEAQLLSLYAEQARPHEDESYRGFYLEELPPRFPRTHLFRLPSKWAYEFIIRKDHRDIWDENLNKEYIFFNRSDFDRIIKSLGARMVYSAPHWDQEVINRSLNKKIKLFAENGNPVDAPPTSFVIVAQKTSERSSLGVHERKPCKDKDIDFSLMAMRDEVDGKSFDIVSRGLKVAEIIPYLVTGDDRLHIFVHEEVPRALMNTIRRNGPNLDGKQWSGHMNEALAIPMDAIKNLDRDRFRDILNFSRDNLDLVPKIGSLLEEGPGFYPAPDTIDEHIDTLYLHVEKPDKDKIIPKVMMHDTDGFSTKGFLREIDAQQILDAIAVGLIPSSRLEVQLLCLYEKLGLSYKSWAECPLEIHEDKTEKVTKIQEIVSKLSEDDSRFKEIKGSAGQIKAMQSVFVDEGLENGGATGLASRSVDFIINEESSMNVAAVLPLSRSVNGEVMAGIVEQYLPIPQRYKGNGYTVTCPSFPLPKEIENFQMAIKYIADQFEVPVECVARMGEGYFSYIGLTPQRIYPFAVTTPGADGWMAKGRGHGVTSVTPLYSLGRLLYWDNHDSFLQVVAQAYKFAIGLDSTLSAQTSFSQQHSASKGSPSSSFSSSSSNNSSQKKYDR